MTEEERVTREIWAAIDRAYELHADRDEVSAAWLATAAMVEIDFPRELHPVGYDVAHLMFHAIADDFCRKKWSRHLEEGA